jgi:hypothetical protein
MSPAMSIRDLPTLAEVQTIRRAPAKGLPHQLVKKAEKVDTEKRGEQFRAAVWMRDRGCCRATGKPLKRSGTTDWSILGEVDHSIPRSLAPERIYDVGNGLLLTKELNRLRKVACPRAPEFRMFAYDGPDDRQQPQTFTWRNEDGAVTKQRIG